MSKTLLNGSAKWIAAMVGIIILVATATEAHVSLSGKVQMLIPLGAKVHDIELIITAIATKMEIDTKALLEK